MCIYIYIYVLVYVCVCIYIYTHRWNEQVVGGWARAYPCFKKPSTNKYNNNTDNDNDTNNTTNIGKILDFCLGEVEMKHRRSEQALIEQLV